ncbi:MAG: hypothetical protein IRZ32_03140 [Solirubrobacteraceae bacterium]|nr:hypothetical protein [Solirubrobacteraceae bacterium]
MTPKQIATNQAMVSCDVCGRTLLRGEHADVFLHGGQRRNVCELCTQRAALEGWIREGLVDDMPVRQRGRRERGSFFARLRRRSAKAEEVPSVENGIRRHAPRAAADEPLEPPVLPYGDEREPTYVAEVAPAPAPPPAPARTAPAERVHEPRHVHAVPTNADMKRARAVELFNASPHPRTIAGVARSLGAPFVVVRPSPTEGSIVSITTGWELCWYRYEVDLADEAAGVRLCAQGDELSQLDPADQQPNAAADARGEIHLVSG